MVWCSHHLKKFPQYVVIHRVKEFSIVNEAEVDVFLKFLCLLYDPTDVGNLSLFLLPFKIQLVHLGFIGSYTVEA